MKTTIKQTTYSLEIGGKVYDGFKKESEWEGMAKFTGPAGEVIVKYKNTGPMGFLEMLDDKDTTTFDIISLSNDFINTGYLDYAILRHPTLERINTFKERIRVEHRCEECRERTHILVMSTPDLEMEYTTLLSCTNCGLRSDIQLVNIDEGFINEALDHNGSLNRKVGIPSLSDVDSDKIVANDTGISVISEVDEQSDQPHNKDEEDESDPITEDYYLNLRLGHPDSNSHTYPTKLFAETLQQCLKQTDYMIPITNQIIYKDPLLSINALKPDHPAVVGWVTGFDHTNHGDVRLYTKIIKPDYWNNSSHHLAMSATIQFDNTITSDGDLTISLMKLIHFYPVPKDGPQVPKYISIGEAN